MTTVSVGDQRYNDLLQRFKGLRSSMEFATLEFYHNAGKFVDEFVRGEASKAYGSATMKKLAEDLKDQEVFPGVQNLERMLYLSRQAYLAYPDYAAFAKIGGSFSHMRVLMSYEPDVRARIEEQAVKDGKIISVRQLEELAKEVCQAKVTSEAAAAVEKATTVDVSSPTVTSTTPDDLPGAEDDAPEDGHEELRTPSSDEPIPANVSRTGAPTIDPDEPTSPLKPLKLLDKTCLRALSTIPDAFKVVEYASKKGFDSERAQKNFHEEVRKLNAALASTIDPLIALQKHLAKFAVEEAPQ